MARTWYSSDAFRRAALTGGAFLGVIVFFWLALRLPWVSRTYERVEAGVVRVGTGIGNAVNRLTKSEKSLATSFQSCQDNLRTTTLTAAEADALRQRVAELESLLAFKNNNPTVTGLMTHVVARSVDNDTTRVIIDKGSNDGVRKGAAAVIDEGVLFGIVDEVREQTSIVRLVANIESNIPASILASNGRTIGLVEGREGALLAMEFIPQDADLKPGDIVVTSGLDGLVPAGLVIGLVTDVVSVESAPFQRAFIELLYEPREWTTVLLIPPPGL